MLAKNLGAVLLLSHVFLARINFGVRNVLQYYRGANQSGAAGQAQSAQTETLMAHERAALPTARS